MFPTLPTLRFRLWLACLIFISATSCAQTKQTYVFIGGYTDEKPDNGIYVYSLNSRTGELKLLSHGENLINPSYLAVSPNGQFLYACTDTRQATPGSITAFKIDSLQGSITFLNKQSSAGANPVYLDIHKSNRFIVTGNYTEGNIAVLTADKSGLLQEDIQSIRFKDSSINKARQEKSHIHSTVFSPAQDFMYSPDLGADKIRVFAFNAENAKPLTVIDSMTVHTEPGAGPRHMAFHPNGKFAYNIEEMGGMVSVYSYDHGKLTRLQRLPCNQKTATEYSSADIHISPDGLFLYASNRVENTIAICMIAPNGTLTVIGHESTGGETPRNFAIDPSGNFIVVANQAGNNIVVLKRDVRTGLLKNTKQEIHVPKPTCVQIREYGR